MDKLDHLGGAGFVTCLPEIGAASRQHAQNRHVLWMQLNRVATRSCGVFGTARSGRWGMCEGCLQQARQRATEGECE